MRYVGLVILGLSLASCNSGDPNDWSIADTKDKMTDKVSSSATAFSKDGRSSFHIVCDPKTVDFMKPVILTDRMLSDPFKPIYFRIRADDREPIITMWSASSEKSARIDPATEGMERLSSYIGDAAIFLVRITLRNEPAYDAEFKVRGMRNVIESMSRKCRENSKQ